MYSSYSRDASTTHNNGVRIDNKHKMFVVVLVNTSKSRLKFRFGNRRQIVIVVCIQMMTKMVYVSCALYDDFEFFYNSAVKLIWKNAILGC